MGRDREGQSEMQGERGEDGWRESDRGEKMTEEGAAVGFFAVGRLRD